MIAAHAAAAELHAAREELEARHLMHVAAVEMAAAAAELRAARQAQARGPDQGHKRGHERARAV